MNFFLFVSNFNFYPTDFDKSSTKTYQPFIFKLTQNEKKILNINLKSININTDIGQFYKKFKPENYF